MACLLVSAAEAVVVSAVRMIVKNKEKKEEETLAKIEGETGAAERQKSRRIPFSRKLGWLANLLWGGAALLAFEHMWHGEIVPWFPFLTAMSDSEATAEMLHEMATVGVTMALLTTAVWGVMLLVSHIIEKRAQTEPESAEAASEA